MINVSPNSRSPSWLSRREAATGRTSGPRPQRSARPSRSWNRPSLQLRARPRTRAQRLRRSEPACRRSRTGAPGCREAYSALLREFSAQCSRDLVGHERRSAQDLELASSEIDSAASALEIRSRSCARCRHPGSSTPVGGRGIGGRGHDRLNELRVVQQDPPAAAGRVRFQIRDAQLLAVNLGLVKQWGSVLDAQVLRVDRAVAALTGRHPDYWGYLVDLRAISDFVSGVVSKMKDEARR